MEEVIISKLLEFIREDAPFGDVTTELLVPSDVKVKAVIIAKDDCIVAGVKFIKPLLEKLGLKIVKALRDGSKASHGDVIMEVFGPARSLLLVERTVLNLLMHLSGIATKTKRIVEKLSLIHI